MKFVFIRVPLIHGFLSCNTIYCLGSSTDFAQYFVVEEILILLAWGHEVNVWLLFACAAIKIMFIRSRALNIMLGC
jgi:hypothetical protein